MENEHRVSLVAEVGNYNDMDKSLAEGLKAIKEVGIEGFLKSIAYINSWARKDMVERNQAYWEAKSHRITI